MGSAPPCGKNWHAGTAGRQKLNSRFDWTDCYGIPNLPFSPLPPRSSVKIFCKPRVARSIASYSSARRAFAAELATRLAEPFCRIPDARLREFPIDGRDGRMALTCRLRDGCLSQDRLCTPRPIATICHPGGFVVRTGRRQSVAAHDDALRNERGLRGDAVRSINRRGQRTSGNFQARNLFQRALADRSVPSKRTWRRFLSQSRHQNLTNAPHWFCRPFYSAADNDPTRFGVSTERAFPLFQPFRAFSLPVRSVAGFAVAAM